MSTLFDKDDLKNRVWDAGAPSLGIQGIFDTISGIEIKVPLVSVVICNYNQGKYSRDAIVSVAHQTYVDFECIVVDDCSTDDSISHIEAALDEVDDRRFRFIKRQQNGGQMAAMFTGFDASSGQFVAFLDADDVWLPSFLEKHVCCHLSPDATAALSSTNLAMVEADCTLISGAQWSLPLRIHQRVDRVAISHPKLKREIAEKNDDSLCYCVANLEQWIWAPTSGLVFRRAVLEVIRPENTCDFRICADLYLARFAHVIGGTIYSRQVHGVYRLHGANMFAKHAVFGDGVANGHIPLEIEVATRRTMAEKLSSDPLLAKLLEGRPGYRVRILGRLLKKDARYVLNNSKLKGALPRKLIRKMRLKAMLDRLKLALRLGFKAKER
ncbi:glycosyltransferase family 2 protein [Rhodomicrobium udaipurense]|uniref:Glycosyltransferase n=1 Tax=Rhodomicrobium udaipurense TaxID=1202716 RepID=A0A8I1GDQ5_9HYPH|nr:glycosyltransferase [Rhodomicrobium udaipurense]MBJ7545148.1 glycosyltransferase [Rhodomicrobium udaipurense]